MSVVANQTYDYYVSLIPLEGIDCMSAAGTLLRTASAQALAKF
jgi:hypothetical protein